jgi:hypothetical protein
LKDLSLFVILFSVVAMTVFSSYSNSGVGGEHRINAQAQVIENSQQPPQTGTLPAIKITSHSNGQQVKSGHLTISGTSSDTTSTNCEVYADWNDSMPYGKVIAAGPGGADDYSKWIFLYSSGNHLIQNGTNNLTSKISCIDGPTNLTKWYSINLIGVDGLPSTDSTINQAITAGLPPTSPPSPPSPPVLPLSAPSQPDVTSFPPDPVGEELSEEEADEDDESNDNEDNNEEDENGSGSEDEDSGNNGDEESGDADGNGGDNDDGDNDNDPVD